MKKCKLLSSLLFPILILSGCNISNNSTDNSTGGNSSNQDIIDGPSVEVKTDLQYDADGNPIFKNVVLNFWSISIGYDGSVQNNIVDRFNEEFKGKIKVERQEKRHDEFDNALVSTITTDPKNAPDIVVGHGEKLAELQLQNIYQSLDQHIEAAKIDFSRDNYFENMMQHNLFKNSNGEEKLYGLPLDAHSNVIIARKDIIEKNGFKVPTNRVEFEEVCQGLALKAEQGRLKTRKSKSMGGTVWTTVSQGTRLYPFYASIEAGDDKFTYGLTGPVQHGSALVDEDGYPAWNNSETAAYLKMFREWMYPTDDSFPIIQPNLGYEFIEGFYQGQHIFCNTGPWNVAGIYNTIENAALGFGPGSAESTLAVIPLQQLFTDDTSKDYSYSTVCSSHSFSIPVTVTSQTKAAAAMVFADWMTKQYTEWLGAGHLPTLKSAYEDESFLNSDAYLAYGKDFGNPQYFTTGGKTRFYSESYGNEGTWGLCEAWRQALNPQTQNKSIEEILNDQFMVSAMKIQEIEG